MNYAYMVVISSMRASAKRRGITSCISVNLRHTFTIRGTVSAEKGAVIRYGCTGLHKSVNFRHIKSSLLR